MMEPREGSLPFRDHKLGHEARISDLISRLTLQEKCAQLRWDAPAVERLGIPEYNWWNEALHGVGRAGKATVFPQAIGLSATWDPDLIERVADAISDEARAKHHEAARNGSRGHYQGLTLWSPNINIFRDPRWGRGQETWGEDPFLTGEMAAAFVRGLQGRDSRYLKTAACAKHLAVHSGPESRRHELDVHPPRQDFEEIYLPAFKRLVDEGVEAVMGAYNAVYGEPCNGSYLLLQEILRDRWGFTGHVVSDCWAIRDFHETHKATKTPEESAALAIRAGCDLNCGSVYCDALLDAVLTGLITEADIDRSLSRVMRTRFRLGMFDPETEVPFSRIPHEAVCCEKHRQLALESAARSVVLLKNANNALPVPAGAQSLLLVGPYAAGVEVMLGNYFGISPRITSLIEGIAARAPARMRVDFRKACLSDRPNYNGTDWSVFEAAKADVVIAAMGINPNMAGEAGDAIQSAASGDLTACELPPNQEEYLLEMALTIRERNSPTRLIVVLFGGCPLSIPRIQEAADAILHVWYPGEAGGEAIARILFGDISPEGRLPVTVPLSTEVLPPFGDYSMAGRTYRYMDPAHILYPFGHGLGYSDFRYTECRACPAEGDTLILSGSLENLGPHDAGEIIQVYAEFREAVEGRRSSCFLVAFKRVFLHAGATTRFEIPVDIHRLVSHGVDGRPVGYTGRLTFHVGGCPPLEVPSNAAARAMIQRVEHVVEAREA